MNLVELFRIINSFNDNGKILALAQTKVENKPDMFPNYFKKF